MAKQYAPHIERLLAVAAGGKLLAVGGRRDAVGITDSSVHLLQLPKLNARFNARSMPPQPRWLFAATIACWPERSRAIWQSWRTVAMGRRRIGSSPIHNGAVRALVASTRKS